MNALELHLEGRKAPADQEKHFAIFFKALNWGEIELFIERGYRES